MRQLSPLRAYIAFISLIGFPLGLWSTWMSFSEPTTTAWGGVVLLVVAMFVGEAMPVRIHTGRAAVWVTFSGGFTVAMVLVAPVGIAIGVLAIAVLIDELRQRRERMWIAFNIAQLALLYSATHWAYALVTGQRSLGLADPPTSLELYGILAAGATYLLVNHVVVGVVMALLAGKSLARTLLADPVVRILSYGMDLSLAPLSLAVLSYSAWFLPLLMLPAVIMHRTTQMASSREREALHDVLTGLPNRALLRQRFEALKPAPGEQLRPVAVMLVDLDHFKDINDTLGHQVGDDLLCEVSRRLLSVARDGDTVARLGGDEFAILAILDEEDPAAEARGMAERYIRGLREAFTTAGVTIDVQGSLGVALGPLQGSDMETLMSHADVALYVAKENRGTWSLYDPGTEKETPERLSLMTELRSAIDGHQLLVHYQPKVELASGVVTGVEALVRWHHPEKGWLDTEDFLPAAKSTGLVLPMTLAVLNTALAQLGQWRAAGETLTMSINVSGVQLADRALPSQISAALARHGIPPSAITIEVSEVDLLADVSRSRQVLEQLHELGVALCVDDYGTGNSSLAYLRQLRIGELKIHESLIRDVTRNCEDELVVRAMLAAGQALGIAVTAEGVEGRDTWELLQSLGCDSVQGFALAPALAPIALVSWLRERRSATVRTV